MPRRTAHSCPAPWSGCALDEFWGATDQEIPAQQLLGSGSVYGAWLLCRYAFLVVNAAVHFWHAARPLMRDGVRAQLLPGHQRLAEALRKVPEGQEWLGRILCSLALCLMEVRQSVPRLQ